MSGKPRDRGGFGWSLLAAPTVLAFAIDAATAIRQLPPWQLALVAIGAISLLLRRRRPLLVLAVVALSFVLTLDVLPLAVAVYAVAAAPRLSRWARLLPAGVCLLVPLSYLGHARWDHQQESVTPQVLIVNIVIVTVLCAVLPTVLGMLVRARRDQAVAIAELLRSREHEARLTAESVRAEERTFLAREMHDVVADKISLISVRAVALAKAACTDDVRVEAETIRGLSKATLEELREVVMVLREPADVSTDRLSALPELVARSGLDAHLTFSPGLRDETWSAAAQRTAYRTVQEALTNVRKYAASARAEIEVTERGDHLDVVVRNEPVSSPRPPSGIPSGGHGLIGLRERADLLGAEFTARATSTGGFLVQVRIPAGTSHQP
jgi:signal transduction histidine kinase